MTAKSEHVKALEAARDRLRPGMLRPDLYMYRWRAIAGERGPALYAELSRALAAGDDADAAKSG